MSPYSDAKQRRSRKYKALHARLKAEFTPLPAPYEGMEERERKMARNEAFRRNGA